MPVDLGKLRDIFTDIMKDCGVKLVTDDGSCEDAGERDISYILGALCATFRMLYELDEPGRLAELRFLKEWKSQALRVLEGADPEQFQGHPVADYIRKRET
jgi:hypothetical protein